MQYKVRFTCTKVYKGKLKYRNEIHFLKTFFRNTVCDFLYLVWFSEFDSFKLANYNYFL